MLTVATHIQESGLSLSEISERSNISVARLQQLSSDAEPSLRELRALAGALGLSLTDFMPPTKAERHAEVLFRERAAQKRKESASVRQFTKRVGGALELLGERRAGVPEWLAGFEMRADTYRDADFVAAEFRRRFFRGDYVSPLLTLPSILVNELDVLLFIGDERAFDGASAIIEGHVFVFVAAQFKPRMLFTLAHELAHLLAHHSGADVVVLDEPEDVRELLSRDKRKEEGFANAFASCLLLPAEGVGVTLKTVREKTRVQGDRIGDVELMYLARIYGVSFQAAGRRCEDLGLLPRGGAQSLYDFVCKAHKSPEKRAEELGLPPRPEIEFPPLPPHLVESAIRLIREGRISVGRASRILNVSIPDIFVLNARA